MNHQGGSLSNCYEVKFHTPELPPLAKLPHICTPYGTLPVRHGPQIIPLLIISTPNVESEYAPCVHQYLDRAMIFIASLSGPFDRLLRRSVPIDAATPGYRYAERFPTPEVMLHF